MFRERLGTPALEVHDGFTGGTKAASQSYPKLSVR